MSLDFTLPDDLSDSNYGTRVLYIMSLCSNIVLKFYTTLQKLKSFISLVLPQPVPKLQRCRVQNMSRHQIKFLLVSKICLMVKSCYLYTHVYTTSHYTRVTCLWLTSGRQSNMTVPLWGKEEHTQLRTVPGQGLLSGWDPNLKHSF